MQLIRSHVCYIKEVCRGQTPALFEQTTSTTPCVLQYTSAPCLLTGPVVSLSSWSSEAGPSGDADSSPAASNHAEPLHPSLKRCCCCRSRRRRRCRCGGRTADNAAGIYSQSDLWPLPFLSTVCFCLSVCVFTSSCPTAPTISGSETLHSYGFRVGKYQQLATES